MNNLNFIKNTIEMHSGFELDGKSRGKQKVSDTRLIYYKIAYEHQYTFKRIGKSVNRKHSAVILGKQRCENIMQFDKNFEDKYLELRDIVNKSFGANIDVMQPMYDVFFRIKTTLGRNKD